MNGDATTQNKPLDEHVRDHFAKVELSAAAVAGLREAIAGASDGSAPATPTISRRPAHRGLRALNRAIAALLLIGLGVGLTLFGMEADREHTGDRLMADLAARHSALRLNEFDAGNWEELAHQMPHLDFELIEPARLRGQQPELILLGSRYCVVGNQLAARVHLIDGGGRRWTLFACRATGNLAGLDPQHSDGDGTVVELWEEDGVLYVLVRSTDPLRP